MWCWLTRPQAEQKLRQDTSTKVEGKVKSVGGKGAKAIPRLNERYRAPSRRLEKQRLSQVELEGDDAADQQEQDPD